MHLAYSSAGLSGQRRQLESDLVLRRSMRDITDGSFTSVLDKGTVDSILCAEGGASQAAAALSECYR